MESQEQTAMLTGVEAGSGLTEVFCAGEYHLEEWTFREAMLSVGEALAEELELWCSIGSGDWENVGQELCFQLHLLFLPYISVSLINVVFIQPVFSVASTCLTVSDIPVLKYVFEAGKIC